MHTPSPSDWVVYHLTAYCLYFATVPVVDLTFGGIPMEVYGKVPLRQQNIAMEVHGKIPYLQQNVTMEVYGKVPYLQQNIAMVYPISNKLLLVKCAGMYPVCTTKTRNGTSRMQKFKSH